jgi:perosamine synthetase
MSHLSTTKQLALFGGPQAVRRAFKKYNSMGSEESRAAALVVDSGILSQFIGRWGEDFMGGPKVKEFENAWAAHFGVKHAITVNSWTSGLVAAVGAIGIEPGDEVIVSPWTMCATATAILQWNAIPVFADIDPESFCLDPESIEKNITPYTKAIMSVDIGGQSADMNKINAIAKKHNLKVISDTAQAPGALYNGKFAGTLGDVGGFSLNYHKHIHTGEGGVLVTNDDNIAEKLCLIRNHAEAVVEGKGNTDLANMLGHNFRLGEIECAIGIEQLKKLDRIILNRQDIAEKIKNGLKSLKGLNLPVVRADSTHVYYMFFMTIDSKVTGVSRDRIFEALVAEGIVGLGTKFSNVHLLPMYQKKIAYGSKGFPWNSEFCRRDVDYKKGICPVAENLHDDSYLGFQMCMHVMDNEEIEMFIEAFKKVWSHLDELK